MSVGYSRPNWARSSIIYLQIDSLQFKKHVPEILVVCVKRSSRATQSGSKCSITGNTTRLCVRRWEIIIVDRQKLTIFQEFSCAPLLQEHLHQRNVLLGTHQATTKVTKKKTVTYTKGNDSTMLPPACASVTSGYEGTCGRNYMFISIEKK